MSVPSNNQHYLVGVVSWGKGCAAVRISDYYKDRRVERQSCWPEALFKHLATLLPLSNFVPLEIRAIRNAQFAAFIRDAKLFLYI